MKKTICILLALVFALCCAMPGIAEIAPAETPSVAEEWNDEDWAEADGEWLYEEDEDWTGDDEDESYDEEFYDDFAAEGDDFLDEEDVVEDTLLSAMEVYSWFVMQPLDGDPEKPSADGTKHEVLDERFNTESALRAFASQYFSDEIVAELMGMGEYTEIDGKLYVADTGRMIDENLGEMEFQVTEETAEKVVYTVTAFYWDDEDGHTEDFTYVRELIDGTWKFTEFPFFW